MAYLTRLYFSYWHELIFWRIYSKNHPNLQNQLQPKVVLLWGSVLKISSTGRSLLMCTKLKEILDLILSPKQPRKYQLQYNRLKWSFFMLKCKLKTVPVEAHVNATLIFLGVVNIWLWFGETRRVQKREGKQKSIIKRKRRKIFQLLKALLKNQREKICLDFYFSYNGTLSRTLQSVQNRRFSKLIL